MLELLTQEERDVEVSRLLRLRIRSRIEQLGTSAKSISIKAGLGDGAINDILRARSKAPSFQTVAAIAHALDVDLGYLIGTQTEPRILFNEIPLEPIPIIGIVEAGSFRVPMEPLDMMGSIRTRRSQRYPNARHFAYTVRGNSMNAATHNGKPAPIVDGMIAICVDTDDAGHEVESDNIVVVCCERGGLVEHTLKKAIVHKDRTEFISESHDERHEPLVIPHAPVDPSQIVARVIGLLISVQTLFESY